MAYLCSPERPQSSEMSYQVVSSQPDFDTRESTIQPRDVVLIRLPNGDVRGIKIDKDTYVF